ncbi:MAG: hypothetical protein KC468_33435, partial [Myxococcales bacterium]|nr:hypothetical protein [Myxococcales bacterium]
GALGELAVTFTPREVLETLLQEQLGSHALLEPLIARRDASPLPTVDALLELRGRASTPTSSINSRPSSPPTPELP